ncbi:MAG: DUF4268 domain-containing protein [Prevotellaceae bacterium]|nr:DUF4268 domain-containing protein [Prevotellaceae bacterium]MDY5209382.1 DUF4268 domain-containing protein [Prevotella sp.]
MNITDKIALYQEFIKKCTSSEGSWSNYSQFSRIDKLIKAIHPDYSDLIYYSDPKFVRNLYQELLSLEKLPTEKTKDTFKTLGGGQYHNAMATYIRFLEAVKILSHVDMSISQFSPQEKPAFQIIYYGAPGTGKSHRIKKELKEMNVPEKNIFRTTFHPDSDYSSFVGAYKPTMKPVADEYKAVVGKDEEIAYSFVPQTFIKAYMQAYLNPNHNIYLIIEEINRGNCAQIFGDLFQLLDRDENGVSEYPIKADSDLKMYLEGELGKTHDGIKDGELCLPSNLYIWATMNTSDQSLFPIDSAFKRRWDWEYEPIKYENSKWEIEIDGNMYSWTSFQEKVNNRIFEATNSEDKMLGDFFVKPNNNVISEKQFINKVLFYLWNDVCKDGDGDIFKTDDNKDVKFSDLYDTNASVTLKSMMKNLGIGPKSESEEYNGESETPESTDTERKTWNEIETKRYEFWEAFLNYAQQNTTFAKHFGGTKKPSKDHWKNFFISGNKDFYLVAVQQRKKNAAEVQVYFDQTNDTYHRLFENKEKIEQEMNVKYEWLELPEKKASVIKERKYNVDFEDKDKWNSIFDFYIDRLLRMKDVFVKYSK